MSVNSRSNLDSSHESTEHLPRPPSRLRDPFRRRDERHPEKPLAAGAESRAGKHDHALLLEKAQREFRARDSIGKREPEVHRALRRLAGESDRKSTRLNSSH